MATRVTSTRLVGRAGELAELEAAFAEAGEGSASVALVAGDSGVGKSRLVAELVARAVEGGGQALSGECVDIGEGEIPYAPLLSALRPLARDGDPALAALPAATRAELAAVMPALDRGAATAGDAGAQGRLFEAVLALLRELGGHGPVLLVLEDIHWADSSTRAFLAYLARTLSDERVLVVATYRIDELHRRHPVRPLLAELERDARVRHLRLAPLTPDELAAALGDILGAPPAAELVERLHARSEGNPLFMEEILAAGPDGQGALPLTLRDALMLRIERLPESAQELLRVLAVGVRLDHELLAEAGGLDARELRESLRAAVASHIVSVDADGGHRYRHALLREVVYDDLLPGEAIELHRALARAYERRAEGGDAGIAVSAAIASHRLAAGDRPEALAASVRAGTAAADARAPGEAAALLERALELWSRVPDPEAIAGLGHVDLLSRAADAHNLGGRRDRAAAMLRAALQEVDAAAEPRRAASMMARLARIQWHLTRTEEALDTLRAGLELLPPGEDSPGRAALLGMWARGRMFQGHLREAAEWARETQRVAEACGDAASLGVALNVLGTSLISLGEIEEGAAALRRAGEIAFERGDPLEIDPAASNLADALHRAGRSREALEAVRWGSDALAATPGTHRWLPLMAGELAFDLGDWEEAARTIPEPWRRFDERTTLVVLFARLQLALGRGDLTDAAEKMERVRPALAESTESQFIATFGVLQAELLRRRGELDGAGQAVEAAMARIENTSENDLLVKLAGAGAAVEADAAQRARDLGDEAGADGAVRRLGGLLDRARAVAEIGGPVVRAHLATAEADAARAAGAPDPALYHAAAEAWDAIERPYPAAQARWREAEAHLALDNRDAAAAAALAALETARRLGSQWLVVEVEQLASRGRLRLEAPAAPESPAAADDPFELTPRERQVLALVARGATNREIGRDLYMSEKTASVHVSRILAKLDVRSRTQAAAVAHRLGLAEEATAR
jgi:DNA-binding CsgD family transcriptional regulator/tetratricopeptide (TPR) repeat protein